MPCLWLNHNKSQIFINVAIFDANGLVDLGGGEVDFGAGNINDHMFKALVDTGAQRTMISKAAAQKLKLRPIGKFPVLGVGGVSYHNNYLFNVGFVVGSKGSGENEYKFEAHILQDLIQGGELDLENAGFDVLLGMDVLATGSLAVEGVGTFSFSF
ncbi:hypothetical protein EYW49_01985 [Siculibacillus lacustris]|uniref:Peptidase A2 domain-containing protein n=1 Tax=Siculibacillus lacustris TaxID=1549641 RepID=A0A4Q9VX44_9HYPH|nr:retropepsin-like aspartic protease [Siculibacillus lacustris]TBW40948.1 hypothetical protein EYW49_01985 [Siculibacillus lacustris]